MKYFYAVIFFCISYYLVGQNTNSQEPIKSFQIKKVDSVYHLESHIHYFLDKDRSLSLEDARQKKFNYGKYPLKTQADYWFSFKLNPVNKSRFLIIFTGLSDVSEIYIPHNNNRYKKFKTGVLNKGSRIYMDVGESAAISVLLDSIDFSRPFYLKKKIISDWGIRFSKYSAFVAQTNDVDFIENDLSPYSLTNKFKTYILIIFTSFVFFLINFMVSKDNNYLNYSLYLLCTTLMFSVRLPAIYNTLNSIEPKLYYYLRIVGLTSASGFYFYFVVCFLNFKDNFPRIYKLSILALKGIVIFTVLFISLLIVFPFIPYKILIMNAFKIIFTILSVSVFIYLLFQKGDIIFKAVLISSLLLILGNILSIVTNYSFFFLNTVLVEIIIFTGIVSYNNKINSKKRLENKFLFEKERIEKQNLIELNTAKSNFFTNISHEFRTPLTLISNPIDQALEDKTLPNDKREQFKMAKRNSDRLLSLVNQILDLSKIDAGQLQLQIQKGNITQLISALSDSFTYRAKQKQINYLVNIKQEDKDVYYDKDAIEKIVVNLLSNAIKYSPEKGSIVCNSHLKDDSLIFKVKNSGKGFTADETKHIFQRFYQTSEQNQGTGIGLALVKELVELHKGTIVVDSIPNQWTTFTVTLPVGKNNFKKEQFVESVNIESNIKSIIEEQPIHEDEDFKDSEQPILLIIEDNADVRTLLKQTFDLSYNILTAPNGKKGVELALEHIPDIIISDIMMPEKNGIEVTNELKNDERTSHIPIVLLTAKAGDENELKGIEIGADDYITKPFNSKILTTKVSKLIQIRRKLQSRYSQEVILKPKDIAVNNIDEQFLEKVQTVLEDKLVESSFSIEDFSKAVGMSRMQLHRKIKALTGLSASEFIRSQRLKLAAQLLKKSDINISQVGYSVGFNDHSYFTKCFKEMYNCTPSEYAKRNLY